MWSHSLAGASAGSTAMSRWVRASCISLLSVYPAKQGAADSGIHVFISSKDHHRVGKQQATGGLPKPKLCGWCPANLLRIVLLGATILQGKFEELEPGKRLVFSWRFNNWEEGCFSKVRQRCVSAALAVTHSCSLGRHHTLYYLSRKFAILVGFSSLFQAHNLQKQDVLRSCCNGMFWHAVAEHSLRCVLLTLHAGGC